LRIHFENSITKTKLSNLQKYDPVYKLIVLVVVLFIIPICSIVFFLDDTLSEKIKAFLIIEGIFILFIPIIPKIDGAAKLKSLSKKGFNKYLVVLDYKNERIFIGKNQFPLDFRDRMHIVSSENEYYFYYAIGTNHYKKFSLAKDTESIDELLNFFKTHFKKLSIKHK
jgi:hypothetical protein